MSASDGPVSLGGLRRRWVSPTLDGDLYAQPLLVGSGVVVATENDSVYLLDASNGAVVWKTHLGAAMSGSALPCGDVDPVGVTSTPVVDASTNRIYVVGMVQPAGHMLFEPQPVLGASCRLCPCGRQRCRSIACTINEQPSCSRTESCTSPTADDTGIVATTTAAVVSVSVSRHAWARLRRTRFRRRDRVASGPHPGRLSPTTAACISRAATAQAPPRTTTATASFTSAPICDSWICSHPRTGQPSIEATSTSVPPAPPSCPESCLPDREERDRLSPQRRTSGGIGGQLHSGTVCNDGRVFGGVAHDGNTLFVPCSNGVVQVIVSGDTFDVGWTAPLSTPGPTIIVGGAVWTVATSDGDLTALDPASGKTITSESIGTVPSQFTSPAAGLGSSWWRRTQASASAMTTRARASRSKDSLADPSAPAHDYITCDDTESTLESESARRGAHIGTIVRQFCGRPDAGWRALFSGRRLMRVRVDGV